MIKKFLLSSRFLDFIPGGLTWLILAAPIVLSIFHPLWVAAFVICFDFYWLIKAVIFGIYLISGFLRIKRDTKINWLEKLTKLADNPQNYLKDLENLAQHSRGLTQKRFSEDAAEFKKALKRGYLNWEKIYQVVILPTYKEEVETLTASIDSYLKADFPADRLIVVVATEKREGETAVRKSEILQRIYKNKFFKFFVTSHPDIPGELKAKGANATWAARNLKKFIDSQKIPYENIVVSCFDADTRVHPQYFACLTYRYILNPKRRHRTFQPIPLYSNNIWRVPPLNRLVAFGSSFWQMIESARPYRMINFSSQAMGFQTLVDIDFWDTTIVSEDSRQFYRAFFQYRGDHRAIPIFTPVFMDAVLGKTFWLTLKNQYLQKRRWAWGVEHFPYVIKESIKHPEISKWERFIQISRILEGHISWSTASLLIAFAIWFPFLLNSYFSSTVLGYNLPIFAQRLLMLTWVGILISVFVSTLLLPPRPKKFSSLKYLEMILQWILIPISAVFYGSIPAVDAQTRLLIGKYLGFRVTEKAQK